MRPGWLRIAQVLGLAGVAARLRHSRGDLRHIEILSLVAHEARQPLASMRVAFEVLRRCTTLDSGRGRARSSIGSSRR